MRKRIAALALCVVLLLVAGCQNKVAKTEDDFTTFAEEKGFTINDCTQQFEEYDYIEKALVAISEDGNYQVEFYQLADEEGACTFYLENYNILADHESDAVSHVESSTKSTQNYEITGKEGYGCISRIGDTCFYSVADKDYKKEVKDFKKEFGY